MSAKTLPMHEVVENLTRRVVEVPIGDPIFGDYRYIPVPSSVENFHPIPVASSDRRFCFVDGGNVQVAVAPNFVVEFTRIYFNIIQRGERKNPSNLPQRIEFYTVCVAVPEGGGIAYETNFIPVRDEWAGYLPDAGDLHLDSFDPSIMTGRQRAPIEKVSDAARVFSEWNYAAHIMEKELSSNDVLVRDGTLQTFITNENHYAERAYGVASETGVVLTALSKTSSLFTTTGYPLLASIRQLSESTPFKDKTWHYYPIVKIEHPDHRAEMYAVKLHAYSDYVFRLEFFRNQHDALPRSEVESIIAGMAANSRDITFPGYPYGLVDADSFARVELSERESQEMQFISISEAAGVWKAFARFTKCLDAHNALNNIRGK